MNPNPYVRPELPGGGHEHRGRELLAAWTAERDALAKIPELSPERAGRLVALAGKVIRIDAAARRIEGRETIARALSACDSTGWQTRLNRFVQNDEGDAVALIDELDDLELIGAAAERAGLSVPPLDLDGCVRQLIDGLVGFQEATEYARALGAVLRPDLPAADPLLARTTEKFVALLDIAEAIQDQDDPLPPLRLPPAEPLTATRTEPGRIPELFGEFAFKAGTPPPELPPVLPYEWQSANGRVAFLAVPRVPPPDRTLTLVVQPADDLVGAAVLLGGLRGTVAAGGVVKFDWDDVAAVGTKVEDLFVGTGRAWRCTTPGGGGAG